MTEIWVESGVGLDTGIAFVKIEMDGASRNIPSDEARKVALSILSAAEAADQDLLMVKFLSEEAGADWDTIRGTIAGIRKMRGEL